MQREAIRQGQRTVEQSMEAQQSMTEAFVHNTIGMGRAANRNATEATRQGMVTVAGMMDTMNPVGASTRPSIEQGFDSVTAVQENAWRLFEEAAENGLATYAQLADSSMESVSESVDATLEVHEEVGQRSTDAAVEYERQQPERTAARRQQAEEAETIPIDEATAAEEPAGSTVDAETTEDSQESEIEEAVPEVGLEDLSGIGASYATRLRGAGIDSVEALRDADAAELSESTEISDERISNWQRQARHILDEG